MHLKRYRRATLKEALRAVREELGPDALVLSTREVTATGVRGLVGRREIELTAAAEPAERAPVRGAAQRHARGLVERVAFRQHQPSEKIVVERHAEVFWFLSLLGLGGARPLDFLPALG